jgi:FixJ family two-component response regulator
MSGYTDESIASRGILEEGLAFLQKPFSRQSISAKVRKVLDEAPVRPYRG